MEGKHIPYDKLSKKEKKVLDAKKRRTWQRKPQTQSETNRREYKRVKGERNYE